MLTVATTMKMMKDEKIVNEMTSNNYLPLSFMHFYNWPSIIYCIYLISCGNQLEIKIFILFFIFIIELPNIIYMYALSVSIFLKIKYSTISLYNNRIVLIYQYHCILSSVIR